MSKDLCAPRPDQRALEDVRAALSFLMPDLAPFWPRPLKDYAFAVYEAGSRGRCSVRGDAMSRMQSFLARTAVRAGANKDDAEQASRQMAALPVMQSGPHCHLLIEPDAFYTHLFSGLGLTAHGQRWHICYSSSTVKFVEKSKRDPAGSRLTASW